MSAVKVIPDRTIDLALLFHRFLVVSKTGDLLLQELMSYELSSFPLALFETRNVYQKPDEHQLAHAICEHARHTILGCVPETESTMS